MRTIFAFAFAALCASSSALVMTPAAAPALRARAAAAPAVHMMDAGSALDAASSVSQLLALSIPIPEYSLSKVRGGGRGLGRELAGRRASDARTARLAGGD